MLKNIDSYIKEFKKDFKKLQKNQNNITYDLDYLFNVIKEVREVFNELRSNLSREETKKIRKKLY